ncbi:helix-turn-helix domain-containing protein [[Eubacterium] hominis]|uniref:helix-turn-helix domain-containing protein n=1 Tax=[Eubacterium] hominis TaxID=2764325 RepID=UPI003A4E381C
MENINFGKLIKQRLKELNMTQGKLANKLGVTASQVSHYLTGKNEIPYQNMVKICKILDLNLNRFYHIYDGAITEEEMKLIETYRLLDATQQTELSHYMNYLLYQQHHTD